MFRGSASAKIDDKGRLKMPTPFKRQVQNEFGPELFLTSLKGDCVQIYPFATWEQIEQRLAGVPNTLPAKRLFVERVNYFGQQGKLDSQGRVVLSPILRESAEMVGEVVVFGALDHFEVWNHENLKNKLKEVPFTDDDLRELSELGI